MRKIAVFVIAAIVLFLVVGARRWGDRPPPPALVFVARNGAAGDASLPGRLMASRAADMRDARPLAPEVEVVGRPDVSFDGLRVLFAGQGKGDAHAQIWQVRRDGRDLKRITREDAACTEPHYLPGAEIVFTRSAGQSNALYTCTIEGEKLTRITFNVPPITGTQVIPDGRILATMGGAPITVNSDGTGVARYTGTREDLAGLRAARGSAPINATARPHATGHVSVVDREKRETGLLFCMNAYLSDRPGVQDLPDGTIKKVRVWARSPQERLLGEAPVEPDGSFLLEVPSDTPLRVETFDAKGRSVGGSCAYIWLRPNESRGCIGCHESTDLQPDNHVQMAIEKKPVCLVTKPAKPAK